PRGASEELTGSGPVPATEADLTALIAAAKLEGSLTTIGLRHDWCNYGEQIETFKRKYAIDVSELSPEAGFGDQLTAITASGDSGGAQAPDVIDVSQAFAVRAKAQKLIEPYQLSTVASIPAAARDPDGAWYGSHYAVLAFETNTSKVPDHPTDWPDLLLPAHRRQVALAGDPQISPQAIATVYAAALGNGGSVDDAAPGLAFFKKLDDAGTLLTDIAGTESIDAGTTPITVRWTDTALVHRDATGGDPLIDVTVPTSGRLAGAFAVAISAVAPHPNAARLWLEFLTSDEGQATYLEGHCNPIRLDDMTARNIVAADVLAGLPDTSGAIFPTEAQLAKATDVITKGWDKVVGVSVR
nr:extracellular solute-binding protein [Chloroflexota bacterium]